MVLKRTQLILADMTQYEQQKVLTKAIAIAEEAHASQKRRDGKPYFSHLMGVATIANFDYYRLIPQNPQALEIWGPLKTLVIAGAYLHDTIEDTHITRKRLREEGIPEMVVDAVFTVTKRPGEIYFDFIMRIHGSGDVMAKVIKLADLEHNMSDLKEGAMKDKYRFAHYILSYFNKP